MSAIAEERPPAVAPGPAPIACPRCGAAVRGDQDWCVECGLAARTRMAPIPDWRVPTLVAAGVALVAIVALIVAFAILTSHNEPVAPAATAPVTPTQAPDATATAPTATTTTPAATAPPATTTPAP